MLTFNLDRKTTPASASDAIEVHSDEVHSGEIHSDETHSVEVEEIGTEPGGDSRETPPPQVDGD